MGADLRRAGVEAVGFEAAVGLDAGRGGLKAGGARFLGAVVWGGMAIGLEMGSASMRCD